MARKKNDIEWIPPNTDIEVISIKGDSVYKTVMAYSESRSIKKKKGWTYLFYQLGFSQFKTAREI